MFRLPGHEYAVRRHIKLLASGSRVCCRRAVSIDPFLAGNLSASPISHRIAIMGKRADRKADRLKAARTGAHNCCLGGDRYRLAIIQRKTDSANNAPLDLKQGRHHDAFKHVSFTADDMFSKHYPEFRIIQHPPVFEILESLFRVIHHFF